MNFDPDSSHKIMFQFVFIEIFCEVSPKVRAVHLLILEKLYYFWHFPDIFRQAEEFRPKELIVHLSNLSHLLHTTPEQLVFSLVHSHFCHCLINFAVLWYRIDNIRVKTEIGRFQTCLHESV